MPAIPARNPVRRPRSPRFLTCAKWLRSWRRPGCLAAAVCAGVPALAAATGEVSVSGNHLLRDGAVWVPHGLISIAFVAPPAAQHGVFTEAYRHFSKTELTDMKAWGRTRCASRFPSRGWTRKVPSTQATS